MEENKSVKQKPNSRKKALLLSSLVIGGIAILLYFEQVAVIYVLSTLGLIILLAIVAFADLEKVGRGDEIADSAGLSTTGSQSTTVNPSSNKIADESHKGKL